MVNALSDVESSILDCKTSIEEFDNELLSLHTEIFDRIQDQFSNLHSEISNIIDLFDEFDVSDDKGIWSKEGIAQLGLLTQQYELAQYQIQQYNNEIDELNAQYLAGNYSATEYADRLAELSSAQWDAVKSMESAKDAIVDLNKARIDAAIEGIEKEIDAYKELTDAQISTLQASKNLHDYENSIAEKTKSITELERQIAAMQYDTSAATVAKRKQLELQLAEAKKELEEAEYEHSIEAQEDALNKQYENYEKERNDEIEALKASLTDKEALIADSFNTVKENADIIGQEIANMAVNHGITVSDALISSWQSGENAIASYGEILSQGTSAFIGNIMGVEAEMWNLQANANTTADSLAWMFSTRADNLVNELTTSYYAETNLANMTNALQQSLVNALERGYNVSSIVNALNSVESAANSAKAAIDRLNNTPSTSVGSGAGSNTNPVTQNTTPTGSNTVRYQVCAYDTGKVLEILDHEPTKAELDELTREYGRRVIAQKIANYASGTRNSKGGLIIKDEEGSEAQLTKLSEGKYALATEGSQIFTKAETDNLFDWSKFNPDDLIPLSMTNYMDELREMTIPQILPNSVNNNSPVQIGNLIHVEGNIDSSNVKQMEVIANKAVNNLVNKLHDGLTYGR